MTNWREKIEDKIADLDLWAVKQVNERLDHLTAKTGEFLIHLKDTTKSKAQEISKEAKARLADFTRSVFVKRLKL
ncbi:MAG: hypothetical protein RMK91_10015 [Pseudanabaenaceae cyanobacterium SKYGB_i_bin29]|nr:hypothetical protein [Pseudanabaenaceae cyanobacterium SKYG29]MDW8422188.1 hypothetical protein [Pseudanabaenaceae cyanobacterium SKYGB_i_bin29]